MIDIQDIDRLKVTRVRPWSICFDYDDKHYLIHGRSEMGESSYQTLYVRELNDCGKYNLKFILNQYGKECVSDDYIHKQKGHTIVYSQIDKEYFVYKLTKRGFAKGIMDKKVLQAKKLIEKLMEQKIKYTNKIRELDAEINYWR